jgi:hypothetical protein
MHSTRQFGNLWDQHKDLYFSYGETDDYGFYAVKDKVSVHDLHATVLHAMGLDYKKLTYRHAGRDFRLTDEFGDVVIDIFG